MASTSVQPVVPTSHNQNQNQTQNSLAPNSRISANLTQSLPPNHPSSLSTSTATNSLNPKKRPLDHVTLLQSSPYFKMRAILRELRPLFLEVLRAPDFQNSKAVHGIKEKTKLMVDICRQATVENVPLVKCHNRGTGYQEPLLLHRVDKPRDEPPQADHRSFAKPAEEKRYPAASNNHEKPESNRILGTYIVGGSAFGWNFITFHGTKPEYYGRTKESFRAQK